MLIFQGNDFLNYQVRKENNYHKYIDSKLLHYYFKFKIFFNFYPLIKYVSHYINEDKKDFKKVYEFKIKKKDVLFKFDYIYEDGQKVNSLNSIFKEYKDFDIAGWAIGERKFPFNREAAMHGTFLVGIPSSGVHSNGFTTLRKRLNLWAIPWMT